MRNQQSKFKFTCFKRGHRPMENTGGQPVVMNGGLYIGRVCRECLVPFFEFVGEASELVGATGAPLIVEG